MKYNDFERPFRSSRYFGLMLQLPFMHPSTIVRRSAFERWGGFDARYRLAADCDLFLRLIAKGEQYRMIETSVTVMRDGGASTKGYIVGRREYREAYRRNMGDVLAAWFGYGLSMVMYLKASLL
jgi:GT2 family glycosyltransferase